MTTQSTYHMTKFLFRCFCCCFCRNLTEIYFVGSDISDLAPEESTAKIALLGEYDPQKELIIEDPYFAYVSLSIYILSPIIYIIYIFCYI